MKVTRRNTWTAARLMLLSVPVVLLTAACASQAELDALKGDVQKATQTANEAKATAQQALDAAKAADAKANGAQQAAQQASASAQAAARSAADAKAAADKMEQMMKKGMRK
jgi:hypothetical protein